MRTPQHRIGGVTRPEYVEGKYIHVWLKSSLILQPPGAVQTLSTVFGLRHTYDTPVGDETIRGVSGGEKKRVSIAEMMATRVCIGCWDK